MTRPERPVTEDDLQAWIDDLLPLERQRTVDAWLDANPDTRERVVSWKRERDILRAAMDVELRRPVAARFHIGRLEQRTIRHFNISQLAASVVLALVFGVGSGWLLRDREVPVGLSSVDQEATIAYNLMDTSATAQGTVAELADWGQQTLGRPLQLPDLSSVGYQLSGSQLVVTDHGPACLFVYNSRNGNRVSLFVRPMYGRDMTAPMRQMRRLPGFVWAQNGLGMSVVGNTPLYDLHGLANQMRNLMKKTV